MYVSLTASAFNSVWEILVVIYEKLLFDVKHTFSFPNSEWYSSSYNS